MGESVLPSLSEISTAAYWRRICPELHVCDERFLAAAAAAGCLSADKQPPCSGARVGWTRERLLADGYATIKPSELGWSNLVERPSGEFALDPAAGAAAPAARLADGVRRLMAAGWPPTAIVLYDEAWLMGADAGRLMSGATGNMPVFDTLGFIVDPAKGDKGFSPHRDRQPDDWLARGHPEDVASTFRPVPRPAADAATLLGFAGHPIEWSVFAPCTEQFTAPYHVSQDGTAKYATVWIALTEAAVENSCLHFLPAEMDPGYYQGDLDDGPDPM